MDERLQRRRVGLAKRLLEQLDGLIDTLELRQENESLGARRAAFGLGQQVACNRSGASPLTRGVMCAGRSERSTPARVVGARRRESERLLGKLRCDGGCSGGRGLLGGLV